MESAGWQDGRKYQRPPRLVEGRRVRRRPRNAGGLEGASKRDRGGVWPGGGGRSVHRLVGLGGGGWARHGGRQYHGGGGSGETAGNKKARADLEENTRRAYEN